MSAPSSDPSDASSTPPRGSEFLTAASFVISTWTGLRVFSLPVADVLLVAAIVSYGWSTASRAAVSLPPAVLVPAAVLVVGDVVPGRFDASNSGLGAALSLLAAFLLVRLSTSVGVASVRRLGMLFVISAQVNASVAVVSAVLGRSFGLPGVAEFAGRQTGLTSHPNQLALVCVLGLGLLVMGVRAHRSLAAATAGALVLVGGVAVSGSRAGALAAAVVAVISLVTHRSRLMSHRRRLAIFSVGGAAFVLLVGLRVSVVDRGFELSEWGAANVSESEAGRRQLMNDSLDAFRDHPVFGAGSDYLLVAHNSLVQVLAAGGIVLLLSLLPLLTAAVPGLGRRTSRPVSAASVAVVGWLVFGLFQNALTDRFLLFVVALAVLPQLLPPSTAVATIGWADARRLVGANGRVASVVLLVVAAVGAAAVVGRSSADAESTGDLADSPYCSDGSFPALVESSAEGAADVAMSVRPMLADLAAACLLELVPVRGDFDGDGRADRSLWRPESGAWLVEGAATECLGLRTDTPVPGDYDGDGATERAVFRDGAWFVAGAPTRYVGAPGDVPVPGDYDGDGDWDRAVFRDGVWFVDGASTAFLGVAGDIPVPGDFDGDGVTEQAVFRPSVGAWYIEGQSPVFFGMASDVPVPADYDGDGDADIAVYRPEVGGWFVDGQVTEFIGFWSGVPVPADYDGDGAAEQGVYRPEVGGWYIHDHAPVFLSGWASTFRCRPLSLDGRFGD